MGAVCRAAEERELFDGRVPEGLRTMETFPTKFVGIAAQDDTPDLSRTAGVLHRAFGFDPDSISPQDRKEVGLQSGPLRRCKLDIYLVARLIGHARIASAVTLPLILCYRCPSHLSCVRLLPVCVTYTAHIQISKPLTLQQMWCR